MTGLQALIFRLERFSPLTPEARRALSAAAEAPQILVRGRELRLSHPETAGMWLILSGLACRYVWSDGRRRIVSCLIAGDLLEVDTDRDATGHAILTISPVQALHLSQQRLTALADEFPCILRALWQLSLLDATSMREWLINVGHRGALERAAHFFCELFVKLSAVHLTQGNSCRVPLTQTDISDALALSAVHMNRVLREMQRRQLCTFRHQLLTMQDFDGLRSLSGFSSSYMRLLSSSHELALSTPEPVRPVNPRDVVSARDAFRPQSTPPAPAELR